MNIDEVLRWLEHADEELTLVGGQAVALWEHLLGLPILTETLDIDFLGDPAQAEALAEILHYRCQIPEPSDPPPNTAVILDDNNHVVADFLGMVAGLNETDILRRRVPVVLTGGHLVQVLHPFDCLASRLANVMLLPGKRSPRGYDQLRAAIGVCRAYLIRLADQDRQQEAIKMANRIFDLAVSDAGKRVYFGQQIDLVLALPEPEVFRTPAFTEENFPRQLERVHQRRERFVLFLKRRGLLG
ncbi:hypothetical protein Thiowin_02294 [Thiorhodovibrio winogradskyi]|uniref:Nucleotidyl transferase AbiEii toxin, Type IV TA system n=1 Tax=Thiorhodovibrio winogradskyi TaxID=77007 RepID=A0ABZ0SAE8_9GAMM|nr:hypothetical protein [Thiorhodovibrio winogradskyi]